MATNIAELPLSGLRVLVTRPEAQAGPWQQLLTAAGASCAVVTLMAIKPLTSAAAEQAIKNCVMELDSYQHVIFVSQNAVYYGLQWIDNYWPQLPVDVNFYAVGSATARALQQYDIDVVAAAGVTTGAMNSEALLALPELQAVAGDKVLICRGQGGRPLMGEVLTARGCRVDYCELYERQFPPESTAQIAELHWGQPGDVVAVHSGESLDNWHELMFSLNQQQWLQLPVLVPGQRVADKAVELGFEQVIEAENASDAEMLRALVAWRQTH